MLIGADASHTGDRCMRVTIHHCFFDGTRQRHPRVRFAKVHLYNNYTRNWGIYAICASVESQVLLPVIASFFSPIDSFYSISLTRYILLQIYSQCNIYEAGEKKVALKYLTEKVRNSVLASVTSTFAPCDRTGNLFYQLLVFKPLMLQQK